MTPEDKAAGTNTDANVKYDSATGDYIATGTDAATGTNTDANVKYD